MHGTFRSWTSKDLQYEMQRASGGLTAYCTLPALEGKVKIARLAKWGLQ